VGKTNVLTDVNDLYVYSFEQIYRPRRTRDISAIIKTQSFKDIEKVTKLGEEEGFIVTRREKLGDSRRTPRPIVVLDDSKTPILKAFEKTSRSLAEGIEEFNETETGTLKKLAIAQKLSFLNKPTAKCDQCSSCSSYCTVASSFNDVDTWSAKGRLLLTRGIINGEIPISQKTIDILYTCSNCGLCFAECLPHSEFPEAIRAARNQLTLKEHTPQIFRIASENIAKIGDPGGLTSRKQRISWLGTKSRSRIKKAADVLYWVGCTVASRTSKAAKAFVNILNGSDVNFTVLGEKEGCCGYILLTSGLWSEAKKNATKLIENIEKTKAEVIVSSCAGCYYTFSKLFPEVLDINLPCEVLHASQFIEGLIGEGRLDFSGFDGRVTYHDPCSLGRHANVFDAPRNVLAKIPKLEFVESSLKMSRSRCCGGGGGLWSYNNAVSMSSAVRKLMEDVVPLNADVLTTACPTCQMNFRFTSIKNSIPIEICDFTEIVEAAMVEASVQ
jgi:Fe-S oxidoreductase